MQRASISTVSELFKPLTWFPPLWVFACGILASGVSVAGRWLTILVGVVLAGPMVSAFALRSA
jgi:chlorophyll synthase